MWHDRTATFIVTLPHTLLFDFDPQCSIFNWHLRPQVFYLCVYYTLCPKNVPLCDCLYLRQKLTDFLNSFTGAFCAQLAIKWLLNIPPPLYCVTTLPREIQMQEKLTIIDSKRVGEQNTLLTKNAVNDLYDAKLC